MKKTCTFYIVRHGETEWNVQGIIQGQSDSPLTKNGHNQAKETGELLKDIKFDHVFSSDLLRAKKTAELIALERKMIVETSQLIREQRFSHFEGKKYKFLVKTLKEQLEKREKLSKKQQSEYKIHPDVESHYEMVSRMLTFLREIAVVNPGKKILVVTHGGLMRVFLIHLGFADLDELSPGSISNTGYIVVESDGVEFKIIKTHGVQKAK